MSNGIRVPLHLQKSLTGSTQETVASWVADVSCKPVERAASVHGDYRVPVGRASGNRVFRRYHDGSLDVDAAAALVVDLVNQLKRGVLPLTDTDKVILSVHFPDVFDFMDPIVAAKFRIAQFDLTQEECNIVSAKVSLFLLQAMQAAHSNTGHHG